MDSGGAEVLTGAAALEQVERWIVETDAGLRTTQLTAADARGALCEAMNQIVAMGFLAKSGGQDVGVFWHRTVVALYEASNRWLWTATHRDLGL